MCTRNALAASVSLDVQEELRGRFGPRAVTLYNRLDGTVSLMKAAPSDPSAGEIYKWLKHKAGELNKEALRLYTSVAPERAVPYALKAMEISEKALGRDHVSIAKSLNFLAELYKLSGQQQKAVPCYERVVEIFEKKYGRNNESVAKALDNLAQYHSKSGDLEAAEPVYTEVLEIYRKLYGNNNSKVVSATYNLAILNDTLGRYSRAEPLYRAAIESAEKVNGPNHPTVASGLNNLGLLLHSSGRLADAEPLFKRALGIYRKSYGSKHPAVPTVLNNLALIYSATGRFGDAEKLFEEALAIDENIYGKGHINLLPDLNNLAELQRNMGNLSEAEALFKRALAIGRMKLSDNNPAIATTLNNLAFINYAKGNLNKAGEMYLEAIEKGGRSLGTLHPEVASWKSNLAMLYASRGETAKSYGMFKEVMDAEYANREDLFTLLTENQRLDYTRRTGAAVNAYISLTSKSSSPENRTDVFNTWLRWKGAVMETQQRYMDAVAFTDDRAIREKFESLTGIRKKIASLMVSGSNNISPAMLKSNLHSLYEEKVAIESDLSRLSRRFALQMMSGRASASSIAGILPPGSAYVDYAAIEAYDFDTRKEGEQKYYAFVLLPGKDGEVHVLDLGPAEVINRLVASYLMEMRSPQIFGELPREKFLRADAEKLFDRLIKPLGAVISGRDHLYISPDGSLNLLPFEVMVDSSGNYLIEEHSVSYVTAGRDMMRFTDRSSPEGGSVIFADPDFDLEPDSAAERALAGSPAARVLEDIMAMDFVRLPDTREEADALGALLSKNYSVRKITGAEATKKQLMGVSSPGVLHLATHAYFLADSGDSKDGPATPGNRSATHYTDLSPMLRAGIAMASANTSLRAGSLSSIVTAEEALTLRLRGTDMVVLSACDTGSGEVQKGEGVFGLRRAFIIAGAKSLVMSLWSVPSRETMTLMREFYSLIAEGRSKTDALREAKLRVIRQSPNPFYWGAFVLAGNPS